MIALATFTQWATDVLIVVAIMGGGSWALWRWESRKPDDTKYRNGKGRIE